MQPAIKPVTPRPSRLAAVQHDQAGALASLAAGSDQKASAIEDLRTRFGAVELRIAAIHQDTKPTDTGGTP